MSATAFVAPRRWLAEEASRLDASCYATGGIEARECVTHAGRPWCALERVAHIFFPSRFARRFVTDIDRGVPFLSSSDILLADLAGLPVLSRRATPNLADLIVELGWSLVTRSGTIGRVAYVRGEMAGLAVSEHAIRVAPTDDLASGFLFAFLASAPAQAMIRQRAFGSVVQHIDPYHLRDLPVPTPAQEFQAHVGQLVDRAATARTEAARLLDEAAMYFDGLAAPMASAHDHARATGNVSRHALDGRLDAFHYVGWAAEPMAVPGERLGDLADVERPGIVKRIWADRGVPFVSGIDAFQVRPSARERIRRDEAEAGQVLVRGGQIFVQRLGQRYGLIGRPALVTPRMNGWAATEHMFRITPHNTMHRGRLFAFLLSEAGRRSLMRHSYGTSIPCLNQQSLEQLVVPELPEPLANSATDALTMREQADLDEERGIREVEAWLA